MKKEFQLVFIIIAAVAFGATLLSRVSQVNEERSALHR